MCSERAELLKARKQRREARNAARYAERFPPDESVEQLQARMRRVQLDIQKLHIIPSAVRVPADAHWG